MVNVTIKKENLPQWTSLKKTKIFKHKFILYFIYTAYYKLLGYEIEVLNHGEF